MKITATAIALLGLAGAVVAAPLYHEEGEKEMLPPTHCLNTLLQVNTGAKPKDYSFKKLQEIGMKIPYVVRALAGLDPTLPEITAFLPTDAAFDTFIASVGGAIPAKLEPLLPEILSYHVVNKTVDFAMYPGVSGFETLLSNGSFASLEQLVLANNNKGKVALSYGLGQANVVDTLSCLNGIIHVVDSVLFPPNPTSATAEYANLTSFATALKSVGIADTFDAYERTTVFVPSEEAMAEVSDVLSTLNKTQVRRVLKYHALTERVMSFNLIESQQELTVNNMSLPITVVNGTVFVGTGGAKVIRSDLLTANGVIHVIDKVLLPPGF